MWALSHLCAGPPEPAQPQHQGSWHTEEMLALSKPVWVWNVPSKLSCFGACHMAIHAHRPPCNLVSFLALVMGCLAHPVCLQCLGLSSKTLSTVGTPTCEACKQQQGSYNFVVGCHCLGVLCFAMLGLGLVLISFLACLCQSSTIPFHGTHLKAHLEQQEPRVALPQPDCSSQTCMYIFTSIGPSSVSGGHMLVVEQGIHSHWVADVLHC